MPNSRGSRTFVEGVISSVAFASGDRFVIGCWLQSPIGPFNDIMWIDGSGLRTLIACSQDAADLISNIYHFDHVRVTPLNVRSEGSITIVKSSDLEIRIHGGRMRSFLPPRPLAVTRYVEAPLARWLMGVETYGSTATGVTEWYQARGWRRVSSATARWGSRDLGELVEDPRPIAVGFSNPPKLASIVPIKVTIEYPVEPLTV
jgi:hypothetical protein